MMNNLKAAKRETKTKGELNSLRSKGFIPAVLYGGKSPNLKLSIEEKFVKGDTIKVNAKKDIFLYTKTPIKKGKSQKSAPSVDSTEEIESS